MGAMAAARMIPDYSKLRKHRLSPNFIREHRNNQAISGWAGGKGRKLNIPLNYEWNLIRKCKVHLIKLRFIHFIRRKIGPYEE